MQIINGEALRILRTLPDASVHCVVTSPPYWGLRDYGVKGQLGLEPTIAAYLRNMVRVFREARRVLRPDGTIWVNMGDSYASSRCGGDTGQSGLMGGRKSQDAAKAAKRSFRRDKEAVGNVSHRFADELEPKDMCGMPWRLAFALQADGWRLRQDIIWHKKNPMPESVTDRCTKAHEYVFLLAKSQRYYCDMEAIKEPVSLDTNARYARGCIAEHMAAPRVPGNVRHAKGAQAYLDGAEEHRTKSGLLAYAEAARKAVSGWANGDVDHSAIAHAQDRRPQAWDKDIGSNRTIVSGYRRVPTRKFQNNGVGFGHGFDANPKPRVKNNESFDAAMALMPVMRNKRSVWTLSTEAFPGAHFATFPTELVKPCILAGCPVGGTVLDMFGGAGTTGLVADRLQRNAILIELNADYAAMARRRIDSDAPLFAGS